MSDFQTAPPPNIHRILRLAEVEARTGFKRAESPRTRGDSLLRDTRMLTRLSFAVGPLQGYRLAMDVSKLTTALGALIQDNTLNVEPFERMPQETLQRVA